MPAHASQHAWIFATFCCAGATSEPVMPFPFWVAPQTWPDEAVVTLLSSREETKSEDIDDVIVTLEVEKVRFNFILASLHARHGSNA
jgi:hypothetical protein